MFIQKPYDNVSVYLEGAEKSALEYGNEEMRDLIKILMEFYQTDDEKEFFAFFMVIVEEYRALKGE